MKLFPGTAAVIQRRGGEREESKQKPGRELSQRSTRDISSIPESVIGQSPSSTLPSQVIRGECDLPQTPYTAGIFDAQVASEFPIILGGPEF